MWISSVKKYITVELLFVLQLEDDTNISNQVSYVLLLAATI